MLRIALLVTVMLCLVVAGQVRGADAVTFSLGENEVKVNAGVAGVFELELPRLSGIEPDKPIEVIRAADGKSMALKYAGGVTGKVTLEASRAIGVSLSGVPADAKGIQVGMYIPISYNSGGKWSIGGKAMQEFPAHKPAKPHLFQGTADSIAVLHASGAGFSLSGFGQNSYQQLQDNREWNWGIYYWYALVPVSGWDMRFTVNLSTPGGGDAVQIKPLIDRYGQHISTDFAAKVRSDEDLKRDLEEDKAYYASLNPPVRDRFGGVPGSGEKLGFRKTGLFHIEKVGGKQVLVDPDGNLFFQLGVCALATNCDDYTRVRGREAIYEWLPSTTDTMFKTAWRENDPGVASFYIANLVRKYGEPFDRAKFVATTIDRVRRWGFNSAAAFSGWGEQGGNVVRDTNLPHVSFLPADGAGTMLPMNRVWDPFADDVEAKFDAAFAKLAKQANDPLIIGYFVTNEPSLEDVPKVVPGLKGSQFAAKRRLVQMLQEKYGTIGAFNAAWGTKAQGFEELNDTPLIVSTMAASQDMQEYHGLFLERRYSLLNTYFRKYDPNHLLIGDRWMPGTANSEILVRTAGKYFDVVSVNYYTYAIEKTFLDRIHTWSGGKPLLLSEFYFASRDQGLTGGARQIGKQRERGLAYRNYVEQAAALGYVVGIQWFSHLDQAATGRFFEGFNGEASNIGLVNVADRPYKEFLAEAMKTNYRIYDIVLGQEKAFAYDDPRFTLKGAGRKVVQVPRMTKPVMLDGQRGEWPTVPPMRVGESGLVLGQDAKDLEATFRLAWDDQNLYVFAEVVDTTPMQNTAGDSVIWSQDSIELFTGFDRLGEGGSLGFSDRQILIRGGKVDTEHAAAYFVNAPKPYTAQVAVVPGVDGRSYIIEAAIPFEALGFVPKAGQEILFDLCLNDGNGGRRQLAWNGTSLNSKDRGAWGRAEFTN